MATSPTTAQNDPGFLQVLKLHVVGLNTKQEALKRLFSSSLSLLSPSTNLVTWLSARVQDAYTSGLMTPGTDLEIILTAIKCRLEDSRHDLAQLCQEQLASHQASSPMFTLDGFLNHFQSACGPRLDAWTAPKDHTPARFNAMESSPDSLAEAHEQYELACYNVSGKCSYCQARTHYWKECPVLQNATARGTVEAGWKTRLPPSTPTA